MAAPFTRTLCFFLPDTGRPAARKLIAVCRVFAFDLSMPMIGPLLPLAMGAANGLQTGSLFRLMVMSVATQSITVPAAMKFPPKKIETGQYLTQLLGLTFSFNVTLCLTLHLWLVSRDGSIVKRVGKRRNRTFACRKTAARDPDGALSLSRGRSCGLSLARIQSTHRKPQAGEEVSP